ncbi:MAG TPA: phosphopentomutase [Candidatus Acidoferrum sp.]|nr:phosphopentomutase [Candidatus Acidoferrum sp.]
MTDSPGRFRRVVWIVLDSVGIGALPDAADYDDVGRTTLGHIAEARPLEIPKLVSLGLANIAPLANLAPAERPLGAYGKGATHSPGKDTTTGHWEMAGIWLDQAFPVYKRGFPREIIAAFESRIGRGTIGNKPASGTEIIKELGEEHVRSGKPIVYTSGDSVFQIAAHEQVVPIAELYRMCEIAREILDGSHRVGRVIARPFSGAPGRFVRTPRRHDYAVEPPKPMLLDVLAERAVPVFGVGKIHDIYNGRGVERYVITTSNADGMEKLTAALRERPAGLIFANLVDFDMLYGHRKDVEGFARSLEEFDAQLGPFLALLQRDDLLMITADHGCDPDPRWETTDHSREYVPILAYSPSFSAGTAASPAPPVADFTAGAPGTPPLSIEGAGASAAHAEPVPPDRNIGTRSTLADMGQTIAQNFGGSIPHGASFLDRL